jgi:hypothetical protein
MAQAAPLAGLDCPMVAVPRPPHAGPQAQAAQRKDGRTSIEATSVGSSGACKKPRKQKKLVGGTTRSWSRCLTY